MPPTHPTRYRAAARLASAVLAGVLAQPAASAAAPAPPPLALTLTVGPYQVTRTGAVCFSFCTTDQETCPNPSAPCTPAPGCVAALYGAVSPTYTCTLQLFVQVSGRLTRGPAAVAGTRVAGRVSVTTPDSCFGYDLHNYACFQAVTTKTRTFSVRTDRTGRYSLLVGPFSYVGGLRNPLTMVGLLCATPTVDATSSASHKSRTAKTRQRATPTICD